MECKAVTGLASVSHSHHRHATGITHVDFPVREQRHVHVFSTQLLHQVLGLGPRDGEDGVHGGDVLQAHGVVIGQVVLQPLHDLRLLLRWRHHEERVLVPPF